MQITPRYDVAAMQADMFGKGWVAMDLARRAGVSHMTVARFFAGTHQTPRTAKKLSDALGFEHKPNHYLLKTKKRVA